MPSLPNLTLIGRDDDYEASARLTDDWDPSVPASLARFSAYPPRTDPDHPPTAAQLRRNLAFLSVGCALSFGALSTSQAVQSSLAPDNQLGIASYAGVYAVAAVSSFVGPSVVQLLGPNASLVAGAVAGSVFLAANVEQKVFILAPGAMALGCLMGPWLSARAQILFTIITKFGRLGDERTREKVFHRFVLLFHIAMNVGDVISHLIAALIMTPASTSPSPSSSAAFTYVSYSSSTRWRCGIDADCPSNQSHLTPWALPATPSPPHSTWLGIVGATTASAVIGAMLVAFGMDRLEVHEEQDPLERAPAVVCLRQVGGTLMDPKLILSLPLVLCEGFLHGLLAADFTQFYVRCALSVSHVGWCLVCSSVTQTIGGFVVPLLALHIHHLAILAAALAFQMGLLAVLWLWRPASDDVAVFYVIAAGWGICKAVWDTLLFPVVTTLYSEVWHAPMAVYNFSRNTGLALAFSLHRVFCNRIKILALLAVLPFSVASFAILESRQQRYRKMRASTALL